MKYLLGVLLTITSLITIFLIFICSGWYNVSAMNEESGIMKWIFNTTKNNSIDSRLDDISVPDLKDSSMIKEGFEHYNEMCAGCHGSPRTGQTEFSKNLNPSAPYLVDGLKEADPKELFWITKNGIRMTGMPAWGKTHSDEKIWAIVAFMKTLPDMSAEEYQKMEEPSGTIEDDDKQPDENETHTHSNSHQGHHH
jgi:mono/diheme cytochrome c family protein